MVWVDIIFDFIMNIMIVLGAISAYANWKEHKNDIDRAILVFLMAYGMTLIINSPLYDFPPLIGALEIMWYIIVFCASIYLWLYLYIYGRKRLYSAPVIIGAFLLIHGFIAGSDGLIYIYLLISFGIISPSLMIKGYKNKSGLLFSIGYFGMSVMISSFVSDFIFIDFPIRFFQLLIIILGEIGWLDDKIFYEKKERQKIQNTWLASRIS